MNKMDSSLVITLKGLIKDASYEELTEWYDIFTGTLVLANLIEEIEFEEALDCIDKHVIDGEFPDKNTPGGLYIFSHGTANVNTAHYYWQGEIFIDTVNNHIQLVNHHLKVVEPDFNFDKYVESMEGMPQSNPVESRISLHHEPGNEPGNEQSSILHVVVGSCLLVTFLIVTLTYFFSTG